MAGVAPFNGNVSLLSGLWRVGLNLLIAARDSVLGTLQQDDSLVLGPWRGLAWQACLVGIQIFSRCVAR